MKRKKRVWMRLLPLLVAAIGGLFLVTSWGLAHPSLRSNETNPAPGDVLSSSPAQIKLVFNVEQGLVPEQSFFWVVKEKGLNVIALGQVDLLSADRNVMTVSLPTLDPGVYLVKWVAISHTDQGFSEGSFSFAVTNK